MREPIRELLVARFEQAIKQQFPDFQISHREADYLVWERRLASNLVVFIVLQILEDEDKFLVEIAWSEDGNFPWAAFDNLDVDATRLLIRLVNLWSPESTEVVWDLAPEVAEADAAYWKALDRGKLLPFVCDPPVELLLTRIDPLVNDVIQKLVQYALPVFRQVAERRDIEWPSATADNAQIPLPRKSKRAKKHGE